MARDMPGPAVGPSPGEHPDAAAQRADDPAEADQPAAAAGTAPAVAAAGGPHPPPEPGKPRRLLYVTLPGCWGALIFACLSFTPSLLPRGGVIQGLVCGITAAIGYGLGVLAAWIWRAFADRDPRRPRHWAWRTFLISAVVLFVVAFGLGQYWQHEIRQLMGVTDYNVPLVVVSPFIAALAFCLFLLIGRGLRGLYRWAAKLLSRWIGRRAANATGWILVAGLTYLVISGLLLQGFIGLMNQAYSVRDTTTARGGAPARVQPALGRAGLNYPVGHAGLPGPQLHRRRPFAERDREVQPPPGRGAGPGLRRTGVSRRRAVPGRARGQGP